jgi:hypothetical protein
MGNPPALMSKKERQLKKERQQLEPLAVVPDIDRSGVSVSFRVDGSLVLPDHDF